MESLRIQQVMQRLISNSFNCIDIGCHLGSMLSEILILAPKGHHIAFEPTPDKASWLKKKFPEVDVREVALGDTTGEATFYLNTRKSGFSGLRKHNKGNDKVLEFTVPCQRLDDILVPEKPIDFIKLDVEGGELGVLRGAINTFRHHRPILLFECTKSGLSAFSYTSTAIFELLTQQLSYSIFLLKDFLDGGQPLDFERFENAMQYPFQAFNFIAISKD